MRIISLLFALAITITNAQNTIGKCKGILDVSVQNQCMLDENGIAHCFASFNADPQTVAANTPKDVTFSQIAYQRDEACGIVAEDMSIKCWGEGIKANYNTYNKVLDPQPGKYTDLCVNLDYACAITEDSYVHCWGDSHASLTKLYPKDEGYKAVGCGYLVACAVRKDNSVICWTSTSDSYKKPIMTDVPEGVKFDAVSVSTSHAIGLKTDGTLAVWGKDAYDLFKDCPTDVEVDSVVTVYGGGLAIKSEDKSLICWGHDTKNFVTDCPEGEFYSIGCRTDVCCAIKTNKEIVCWGNTMKATYVDGVKVSGVDNTQEMVESGIKPMDCQGGDACGKEKGTIEQLNLQILELQEKQLDLEDKVELWKLRFEKVKALELEDYNNRHSVIAEGEFPEPENEVGNNLLGSESLSNVFMFTMYLGVIGVIFAFGRYLGHKSNQKAVYTEMSQM
jgi:hypothetical protein